MADPREVVQFRPPPIKVLPRFSSLSLDSYKIRIYNILKDNKYPD